MIECALFEPDIPQNTGTVLRTGACLGVRVHIIHPAGFALSDRNLRRAGLDYLSRATMLQHDDWAGFRSWQSSTERRVVALSSRAAASLYEFTFERDDILLFGRESAGLPEHVIAEAAAVVRIPMRAGNRSLNLAVAVAITIGEALRQTGQLPRPDS